MTMSLKRTRTTAETYREQLLMHLRLRDLPGDRIGEALAEVEAHTAETGEDPREAFGPPKQYARQVAAAAGTTRGSWRLDRRTVVSALLIGVLSWVSTTLLAGGIFALHGREEPDLGLSAGLELALGIVGAALTTTVVTVVSYRRDDPVRDPRTGTSETLPRWVLPTTLAGLYAVFGAFFVVVARLT